MLLDLRTHPEPFVTVAELARYWRVSRKQLYKQIEAGTLHAVRFGPRLIRVRTTIAVEFEANAKMHPLAPDETKDSARGGVQAHSRRM